jgi:hypothetical protein
MPEFWKDGKIRETPALAKHSGAEKISKMTTNQSLGSVRAECQKRRISTAFFVSLTR